jgi:hypothetical protein
MAVKAEVLQAAAYKFREKNVSVNLIDSLMEQKGQAMYPVALDSGNVLLTYNEMKVVRNTLAEMNSAPMGAMLPSLSDTQRRNRQANNRVVASLEDTGNNDNEDNQAKKSALPKELFVPWDAMHKAKGNILGNLKERDYTAYAVIYNERYGKYPQDDPKKYHVDFALRSLYQDALHDHMVNELCKMGWDDLLKGNLTEKLKRLDREAYNDKYFQRYGVQPKF